MDRADAVVAPKVGFGLKYTIVADAPGFFCDMGDQHQHFVCDGEWRFVMHRPDLAFGFIISLRDVFSNILSVILRVILRCLFVCCFECI